MDPEKTSWRGRRGVRLRLLSLGVVVAVIAAGCGGSSTPTNTTKSQTAKKTANTTTVSKPKTTSVAAPNSSVTSTSSSSNLAAFASTGHCAALAGVSEQFAKAMTSATSGGKFNMNAAVTAYKNLANAAPSAIRPDLEVLANAFATYGSLLSKSGYKVGSVPSASQIASIEQAAKALSTSKLASASKAVEAWAVKNCSA